MVTTVRTHGGYVLVALGTASVVLCSCATRAAIWASTWALRRWLGVEDGNQYLRDIYRSEAIEQLGIAGIDPRRPYGLLGVRCDLLKDMMLGGGLSAGTEE